MKVAYKCDSCELEFSDQESCEKHEPECIKEKEAAKTPASEIFKDYTLMDIYACLDAIGFQYTKSKGKGANDIKCCGEDIQILSWLGLADTGYCKTCKKEIQNVMGMWRTSNSTMGMVDHDKVKVEGNKVWAIINGGSDYNDGL